MTARSDPFPNRTPPTLTWRAEGPLGGGSACVCVCWGAGVGVWAQGRCKNPAPPMWGQGTPPPQGGGTVAGGCLGVRDHYFLVFIHLLEVCISCVCACACGWHRCGALRVAGSVFCRGVWAFPSQWGGARGIVCRAWLRSKRDVRVVVVSAHPQVSCAVRGADRGGGAGCRCGLCGTLGRRAGSWRRLVA